MSVELINKIIDFQYNPASMQRAIHNHLEAVTNGTIDIVDPTNPFTFALEAAVSCTAAHMIKNEVNNRKQYPMAAQIQSDLYLHMSDRDYADRFATPSKAKISLMFSKEEILTKMVTDINTGIRKIVIPRNTNFTVAGNVFSIQYPVEIRQLAHGGLQVIYDTDVVSPLHELTTNFIPHEIRANSEEEFIFFELDTHQFDIVSISESINLSVEFTQTVEITDQFYYARIYVQNTDKTWTELHTTHSDQIYDPHVVTAVIVVDNKNVTVRIPQIYVNNGLLTNQSARMDIYQTKGPLELLLWEYGVDFVATWLAIDRKEESIYTAPLNTLRSVQIFSDKLATGGANALTFEELRERVIRNAIGSPTLPITNIQIEGALERKGYGIITNIDNITNRDFLATKEMPDPKDIKLITAAAASVMNLTVAMEELVLNSTVRDNGKSVTLTPDTLYRTINGVTKLVSVAEVTMLMSMAPNSRATTVTAGNYLYTPFHYVLDATGVEFTLRPYYLDSPSIATKLFGSDNDSSLLQVGTASYSINRMSTGYYIDIVTQSGETYRELDDSEVFVQLAYTPAYEKDRAYLNGELLSKSETGERTYRFLVTTNFNIDNNDTIELLPFSLYTPTATTTSCNLDVDFDIIFSTSSPRGTQWHPAQVDVILGRQLLPNQIYGITHEKLRVKLGYSLKTLWARTRSVIGAIPYQTYPADVFQTYQQDIYQRDANGSAIIIDGAGNPTMVKLHDAGDPVLNLDGEPIMLHVKGDIVHDTNGNPIPISGRKMTRQIDLMLIEGAYRFATDASAIAYRNTLTRTLVDWLTLDLSDISTKLLEQTNLYFYPKATIGIIDVIVGEGIRRSIQASQAFLVDVYMNGTSYANLELRDKLTKIAVGVISKQLKKKTISIDNITTELKVQFGNDVIAIALTGLGGELKLDALTVIDDVNRCSLRKRLVPLPDDTLIVEEDVTMNFIRHEL